MYSEAGSDPGLCCIWGVGLYGSVDGCAGDAFYGGIAVLFDPKRTHWIEL